MNSIDVEPHRPTSTDRWTALGILAIFLVSLLPVMSIPVFPMIDFYDHLSRYFVLSRLPADDFLARNYEAAWGILPNIGLDVLGVGLMRLFSPLATAHLIVAGVFATQYFGILFFNKQLTGQVSLLTAVLAAPLLYSFIFTWGFANFLLGLGLVFWAAGAWLALRHNRYVACGVGTVLATLIFLTHGVAFALYGLLVGALELGCLWHEQRLHPKDLARSTVLLAIQAVLPVLLFAASATSKAAGGFSNAGESIRRLAGHGLLAQRLHDLTLYRLETIYRVAESPAAWVDGLSFVVAAVLILLLGWRRRLELAKAAWLAIVLGLALVALTPPTLFGVGYIADRMPLFLAFTVIGAIEIRWRRHDKLWAACLIALISLVAIRLAFIGVEWQRYRNDFAAFRVAARAIPPRSLVVFVDAARVSRLDSSPRCEMYGPLLIALNGDAAPLFAYGSQQPIRLSGALKAAQADQPVINGAQTLDFQSDRLASAASHQQFDFALICDAQHLRRPLPLAAVVAHVGRFTILRTRAAQAPVAAPAV